MGQGVKRFVLGALLAECLRMIRPGGRMAFSVLYIPPGLSPEDHARALETAPEFVESDTDYPTLLAETGWAILERRDLTGAFMESCRQRMRIEDELRAEILPLTGAVDFDAQQTRMRCRLPVLERGHLRRDLFVVRVYQLDIRSFNESNCGLCGRSSSGFRKLKAHLRCCASLACPALRVGCFAAEGGW